MVSDGTYGATKNCAGCRFWSEMIAKSEGGELRALCLVDAGKFSGKYVAAHQACLSWKSGHLGAVDEPPDYGVEVRRLYEAEDTKALAALVVSDFEEEDD